MTRDQFMSVYNYYNFVDIVEENDKPRRNEAIKSKIRSLKSISLDDLINQLKNIRKDEKQKNKEVFTDWINCVNDVIKEGLK